MNQRTPPIPQRKPPSVPIPQHKPYQFTAPALTENIRSFVRKNEDFEPYFYKDSEGNVTIGSGHKVSDAEYAATLPLYWRTNPGSLVRAATEKEKKSAYKKIVNSPLGGATIPSEKFNPSSQNGFDNLGIKEDDDVFLQEQTLRGNIASLVKKFPDFPSYPEPARTALIDMEYNLGRTGFSKGRWPSLHEAVTNRDWGTAAETSHRKLGKNEDRNIATKDLFLEAKRIETFNRQR